MNGNNDDARGCRVKLGSLNSDHRAQANLTNNDEPLRSGTDHVLPFADA
jgi:hypothetical protein